VKTLLTLLGKTSIDQHSGYRKTVYQLHHKNYPPTAFLGWILQEHLRPDQLIVYGTSSSMWDHLFEGDLNLGTAADELRTGLLESLESNGTVSQQQLNQLAPVLSQHLACEVMLRIIPTGLDDHAQIDLFRHLHSDISDDTELYIDCTHGYRHLPMLLMIGALYLQTLRRVSIGNIYYGLYDEVSGKATVCELKSLLDIHQGLQALTIFDHSGDYLPLLKLAADSLPDIDRQSCEDAAFNERVLRIADARKSLARVHNSLSDDTEAFPLILFRQSLLDRLDWANQPYHDLRQLQVARGMLERRDYLRASALLYESVINRFIRKNTLGDAENSDVREQAGRMLKQSHQPDWQRDLRLLRNALAHGVRPKTAAVQQILGSEHKLQTFLTSCVERLEEGN